MQTQQTFVTPADAFRDVSRGDPKPYALQGAALTNARLTPETWRLEILSDGSAKLQHPRRLSDGTAIDLPALQALAERQGVRFFKSMQCLNIPRPLGQGFWEGVPLRDILKLAGRMSNVRRIYFSGFHNNDPKQLFQSSLSYSQVMDSPPGELPAFVALRLNGAPISLVRGGPVRMVVPWAYGFKSIKWLQTIVLTNDYKANDTYAEANNDPESYLKTAAYFDEEPPRPCKPGAPVVVRGVAMVGWSGLERVEYWLRPDHGTHGRLDDDDPAWQAATWRPCTIDPPPADWKGVLTSAQGPGAVWGFDPRTGQPGHWPLRYSWAPWSLTVHGLAAGAYELRVRTIDANGFAQPEPRPYPKSGRNEIQQRLIVVA